MMTRVVMDAHHHLTELELIAVNETALELSRAAALCDHLIPTQDLLEQIARQARTVRKALKPISMRQHCALLILVVRSSALSGVDQQVRIALPQRRETSVVVLMSVGQQQNIRRTSGQGAQKRLTARRRRVSAVDQETHARTVDHSRIDRPPPRKRQRDALDPKAHAPLCPSIQRAIATWFSKLRPSNKALACTTPSMMK